MDALELLTDADLAALAAALRSGRLHAPFTPGSLQRLCSVVHAGPMAARLQQLHDEGMNSQHLALLGETIIRTRARLPEQDDLVDLVWTGPETLGVTNWDTGVVVRDLFGSATSEVLVAGAAVYQGRTVFKRLVERMEAVPQLRVKLFLDVLRPLADTSPAEELLRDFAQRFRTKEWPGEKLPELYYDPRSLDPDAVKRSSLHAKCLIVDRRTAFVTSANFTEAAQTRNIEVGALVRCERFAARLAAHFETLTEAGMLRSIVVPLLHGARGGHSGAGC
jgi:phosphatidylserine/phosphatidylglycerophosphate/cardiolipin synthase-like enzyme